MGKLSSVQTTSTVLPCLMMIIYPGVSVAAVWATQILAGRRRKSADLVDRLGRFLGGLWIAAAVVFCTRSMLG